MKAGKFFSPASRKIWAWIKQKPRWVWVVALVVVAGLIFFGWQRKRGREVKTAIVERRALVQTVSASGQVKAAKEATLKFPTASKVTWVGVKKGDQVRAWQGLAALDSRQLEKNLRKKLLDYQTTRWDFDQLQDDYDIQARPLARVTLTDEEKRILEKSQFGLDQSVLDVEIADLALKESFLVTPVAGTVVAVEELKVGENLVGADLGSSYVRVVDLESLYFEAEFDEVDYQLLGKDQKAQVEIDAFEDQVLSGTVSFVGQEGVLSAAGGVNILVDIDLESFPESLITGLNGEARVVIEEKEDVLVIPREFLVIEKDKNLVKIQEGRRVKEKEVKIGLMADEEVEILEGLAEGDQVVVEAD